MYPTQGCVCIKRVVHVPEIGCAGIRVDTRPLLESIFYVRECIRGHDHDELAVVTDRRQMVAATGAHHKSHRATVISLLIIT